MLVSVITVSHNCASTIEESIRSVIWQSYANIEYIVVDGNSTDGTHKILDKFKEHIDRAIIEPDRGIYDAMNKGIMAATGDIIVFLNADDILLPNGIANAVNEIQKDNLDFYFGGTLFQSGLVSGYHPNRLILGLDYIGSAHSGSFFVKRSVHTREGVYNTKFKTSADYDFFLRIIRAKYKGGGATGTAITSIFRPGGYSSKQGYLSKKLQEVLIRRNNNQSYWEIVTFLLLSTPPQLLKRLLRTLLYPIKTRQ